jgi:hypothetical protein
MKTQLYSDIFVNIFDMEGKGRDTQTCNIVWNMERDQSFWITSSEHQGTMPKGIFSFSCSMANHREIFTTYLTSECQNFQNLNDKCKLIWILNNEDPTILRYLCQYLLFNFIFFGNKYE